MSTDKTDPHYTDLLDALECSTVQEALAAVQGLRNELASAYKALDEEQHAHKLAKRYKREAEKNVEGLQETLALAQSQSSASFGEAARLAEDRDSWRRMALLFAGLVEQAGLMGVERG